MDLTLTFLIMGLVNLVLLVLILISPTKFHPKLIFIGLIYSLLLCITTFVLTVLGEHLISICFMYVMLTWFWLYVHDL